MARYKELYIEQRNLSDSLRRQLSERDQKIKELEQLVADISATDSSDDSYELFKKTFGQHIHRFFGEEMVNHIDADVYTKYIDEYDSGSTEVDFSYPNMDWFKDGE